MRHSTDRAGFAAFLASMEERGSLAAALHQEGWEVQPCASVAEVLDVTARLSVDVVVVDATPAAQEQQERLSRVVSSVDVPVVAMVEGFLDAKRALRQGTALALPEPVDAEMLVLSLRNLLGRRPLRSVLEHSIALDDLVVHVADHAVEREGRRRQLSPTEWGLLSLLMAHPGYTFSRDELVRGIWGVDIPGRQASVDLYVYRLRRKVERNIRRPTIVETVRNGGYRLSTSIRSLAASPRDPWHEVTQSAGLDAVPAEDVDAWLDLYVELSDTVAEAVGQARNLGLRIRPEVRRVLAQTDIAHLDAMLEHCRSRAAYWNRRRRGAEAIPARRLTGTAAQKV